jgi:ABC-type Zn uptake system ZnuABC Zn-binding protein ZnuA
MTNSTEEQNKMNHAIDGFKNNKVIMDFVVAEAVDTVMKAVAEKTGKECTKAEFVALLESDKTVEKRIQDYIDAGLHGVYMAYEETEKKKK